MGKRGRKASFEFNAALIDQLKTVMTEQRMTLTDALRSLKIDIRTFKKHAEDTHEDAYLELFKFGRAMRFGPAAKDVVPRQPPKPVVMAPQSVLVSDAIRPARRSGPHEERVTRDRRTMRNAMFNQTLGATFEVQGALRPQVITAITRIVQHMHTLESFLGAVDDELMLLEDCGHILREHRGGLRTALTVLFINVHNIP